MTTATRSVAVVATRLPNIDRRALSQAWFSALHLAQSPAGTATLPAKPAAITGGPAARLMGGGAGRPTTSAQAGVADRAPVRGRPLPAWSPNVERRERATELARRIERAVTRATSPGLDRSAAVAVTLADGRVHLLVRTDGGTTRIVALCAPHLRERVDRALAHVRFSLAASGTRLEVAQ